VEVKKLDSGEEKVIEEMAPYTRIIYTRIRKWLLSFRGAR